MLEITAVVWLGRGLRTSILFGEVVLPGDVCVAVEQSVHGPWLYRWQWSCQLGISGAVPILTSSLGIAMIALSCSAIFVGAMTAWTTYFIPVCIPARRPLPSFSHLFNSRYSPRRRYMSNWSSLEFHWQGSCTSMAIHRSWSPKQAI